MSAKKFVQLLEDGGLLDKSMLRDLRRQITEKNVSAATIAKALVEKGKLTKFQATKLVGQATADQPPAEDDESGLLLVEDTPLEEMEEVEEIVGLTPVEDAGAALTPVGRSKPAALESLEPLDGGLEPLDIFAESGGNASPDPFATPPTQPVIPGKTKGKKPREKKDSQDWGGKLMIGGGGLLLALSLLGGLLYYSITKQDPIEMFDAGEEAYRSESYSDAMGKFEKFLKKYPKDERSDDARVRVVLCRIRIVLGDPQKAYDTAVELLPTVQQEDAFGAARDELAGILPQIPAGFIKKARQATDIDSKEEFIKKAETALTNLVNKPEYIPSSKRPQQILARIDEDILLVKREVAQNRELAKAIAAIKGHVQSQETVQAYTVYKELLKVYPGLPDNPELLAAVLEITEQQKNLVRTEEEVLASTSEDSKSPTEFRVVLASRSANAGKGVPRLKGQFVAVLAAGAVYGLDAENGNVVWRRFVGHVTQHHPLPVSKQPGADFLVSDAQRNELMRVKAATGELVWRSAIGEPFASPSLAGNQVFVSTRSGKVLQLDAASGQSTRRVVLPQPIEVASGVSAIHPYLLQPGDHSNVYAISSQTLACEEVAYFGHKAGTIAVEPLVVQDHVLIAENAGRDYCLLHVLKITPGGDGPLLRRPQNPIRLTGNVVVPMTLQGYQPVVVTDLGEVNVFRVDFNATADSVAAATAPLPAARQKPLVSYPVIEGTTLILADDKLVKYQLQVNMKKIVQQAVTNSAETFIAPPQLFGDILIATRRKAGSSGATVAALQVDNFRKPEWETNLGVPVARGSAAGNKLEVISAAGALFEVDGKVLALGISNEPVVTATLTETTLNFTSQVEFPNGKVAFFNPTDHKSALVYTPGSGAGRLRGVQLKLAGGQATCIPVAFQDGLLTPLNTGSVLLADTTTGSNLVLPFQPKLAPGEEVQWRRPAVLGNEFVIADDRQNIYRVGINNEPQPFLAPLVTAKLDVMIQSDLAAVGDTIYGVVRKPSGDVVLALNVADLKPAKEFALTGHVVWGPVSVGDVVLCLSSTEGLLCFETGANQRWANSAGCGGQPVGLPLQVGEDYLIALREGAVVRLASGSGDRVAETRIGEPLGAGPVAFGMRLMLPGSDGALHVIRLPESEG